MASKIDRTKWLECCLKPDGMMHFVKTPYLLKCGGRACHDCLMRYQSNDGKLNCFKCSKTHDFTDQNQNGLNFFPDSSLDDVMSDSFLKEMFDSIKNKYTVKTNECDKISMQEKKEKVINQFSSRINSYKAKLDECFNQFLKKTNDEFELQGGLLKEYTKRIRSVTDSNVSHVNNLESFYKYQDKIIYSYREINNIINSVSNVEFIPKSHLNFDSSMIGELKLNQIENTMKPIVENPNNSMTGDDDHTFQCSFQETEELALTNKQIIPFKKENNEKYELWRLTNLVPRQNVLFLSNFKDGYINRLDLNTKKVQFFGPYEELTKPYGTTVDTVNNYLFVGCCESRKISMFDINDNLKLLRSFGYEQCDPDFLEVDPSTKRLYVTAPDYNLVSVWNYENGELIKEITNLSTPATIKIKDDLLFITSFTKVNYKQVESKKRKLDEDVKYKFKKKLEGQNCIYILNKKTYRIKTSIRLPNDVYNPRGLHIDDHMNVVTIVNTLNEHKIIGLDALLRFDAQGKLKDKIDLSCDNNLDFQIVRINNERKIIFIRGDEKDCIVMYDI